MSTLVRAVFCLIFTTLICASSASAEEDLLNGRAAGRSKSDNESEASSRETKKPKKEKKEKTEKSEKAEKTETSKSSVVVGSRETEDVEAESKEEPKQKPKRESEGIPSRADGNAKKKKK